MEKDLTVKLSEEVRDDLLLELLGLGLKTPERRELRDDLEHQNCRDESILGTKNDLGVIWSDSGRMLSDGGFWLLGHVSLF